MFSLPPFIQCGRQISRAVSRYSTTNSVCAPVCNNGYYPSGSVSCSGDGSNWSYSSPKCNIQTCTPSQQSNANAWSPGTINQGSTSSASCSGYYTGGYTATCDASGNTGSSGKTNITGNCIITCSGSNSTPGPSYSHPVASVIVTGETVGSTGYYSCYCL